MDYIGNTAFDRLRPVLTGNRVLSQCIEETLAARVRRGLRTAEFHVAFQPIVHARTRSVAGVECLLRWQHPVYGLLLPASFTSAFDDPDVAREASHFVLEHACAQLGEAKRAGKVLPRTAVNIQPFQLVDETLSASIFELTRHHGVDPSLLELELVENEDASNLLATHEFTRSFRQLGIRLALDDFGSGFSSLASLSSIHIDTIKVAREFLVHLPASDRACTVLTGILNLLQALNMTIVVEGVESAEQLGWLSQYEDIYVQGYYLARPTMKLVDVLADA